MADFEGETPTDINEKPPELEPAADSGSLPVPIAARKTAEAGSGGRWHGLLWGAMLGAIGSLLVAILLLDNDPPKLGVTAKQIRPQGVPGVPANFEVTSQLQTFTLEGDGSRFEHLQIDAIAEDPDKPKNPPETKDIEWKILPPTNGAKAIQLLCNDKLLEGWSCETGRVVAHAEQPGEQDIHVSYTDTGNWLGLFRKPDSRTLRVSVVEIPEPRPEIRPNGARIFTNSDQVLTVGGEHLRGETRYQWQVEDPNGRIHLSGEGSRFPFKAVTPGIYSVALMASDAWHTVQANPVELEVVQPEVVPTAQSQLIEASAQGLVNFPDQTVELRGEIITYGQPLTIRARKIVAIDAIIRAFPVDATALNGQAGKIGVPGRNGGGGGQRGGDGSAGQPGTAGTVGSSAEIITIEAALFEGNLALDVSGQSGGRGGDGGNGGNGGAGGPGSNGASGAFDCSRGPGNGGNGGNAGAGGNGGSGGNGGDAGDVTIDIGEIAQNARISIDAIGGLPGAAGRAGHAGNPGSAGSRGSAPGWCQQTASNGVPGQSASTGREGVSGTPGDDGLLSLTIGEVRIDGSGKLNWP